MMPFDEEEDKPSVVSKGLVKSNQKSIFDNMQKKPTQADLKDKVERIIENRNTSSAKMQELLMKYSQFLKDKTLQGNKGVLAKQLEIDVLRELISLANEINQDENEDQAMGAMALIAPMLKIFLTYRDRINELEYKLEQINVKDGK